MINGSSSADLGPLDTAWLAHGSTPTGIVNSLAWDARNGRMLATVSAGVSPYTVFEETAAGWLAPTISAPGNQTAVSNARAGTVDMFVHGAEVRAVRREGPLWIEQESPAIPFHGVAAYNPRDGSTMLISTALNYGSVAAVREYVSDTPLESCITDTDDDGDGLASCADPDCFWACTRCPPYTSCP